MVRAKYRRQRYKRRRRKSQNHPQKPPVCHARNSSRKSYKKEKSPGRMGRGFLSCLADLRTAAYSETEAARAEAQVKADELRARRDKREVEPLPAMRGDYDPRRRKREGRDSLERLPEREVRAQEIVAPPRRATPSDVVR